MKWYCAHIIMWFEVKDGLPQDVFPIWENVVLFSGENLDEVMTKAEARGKADEEDKDETLRWNDRPAWMRFAGVRKVVECEVSSETDAHQTTVASGVEVTYSEMSVKTITDVDRLAAGEEVIVLYDAI